MASNLVRQMTTATGDKIHWGTTSAGTACGTAVSYRVHISPEPIELAELAPKVTCAKCAAKAQAWIERNAAREAAKAIVPDRMTPEDIYDNARLAGASFDQAIAEVATACGEEYAEELEARIEADPRLAAPR